MHSFGLCMMNGNERGECEFDDERDHAAVALIEIKNHGCDAISQTFFSPYIMLYISPNAMLAIRVLS